MGLFDKKKEKKPKIIEVPREFREPTLSEQLDAIAKRLGIMEQKESASIHHTDQCKIGFDEDKRGVGIRMIEVREDLITLKQAIENIKHNFMFIVNKLTMTARVEDIGRLNSMLEEFKPHALLSEGEAQQIVTEIIEEEYSDLIEDRNEIRDAIKTMLGEEYPQKVKPVKEALVMRKRVKPVKQPVEEELVMKKKLKPAKQPVEEELVIKKGVKPVKQPVGEAPVVRKRVKPAKQPVEEEPVVRKKLKSVKQPVEEKYIEIKVKPKKKPVQKLKKKKVVKKKHSNRKIIKKKG